MAKRRRTVTSHTGSSTSYRPGFSRGTPGPLARQMTPPSARNNNRLWWIAGGVAIALVAGRARLRLQLRWASPERRRRRAAGRGAGWVRGPTVIPVRSTRRPRRLSRRHRPPRRRRHDGDDPDRSGQHPVRDLQPVGAGRVRELHQPGQCGLLQRPRRSIASCPTSSSRAAIPNGDGSGGPGYTIQDEPVVGDYSRGIVAMARTSQRPTPPGSQFFIVVSDDSVKDALRAIRRLRDLRQRHSRAWTSSTRSSPGRDSQMALPG